MAGAGKVSIPFIAGQWSLRAAAALHAHSDRLPVSIPFIAGQWSLQARARKEAADRERFNPLHCGAVVASGTVPQRVHLVHEVSIPFIAGQWSLLVAALAAWRRAAVFQSPSLRGSGRFKPAPRASARTFRSFNPLHCGAVVASSALSVRSKRGVKFQSPSLRGSGRFSPHGGARRWQKRGFQSPSLRGSGRF